MSRALAFDSTTKCDEWLTSLTITCVDAAPNISDLSTKMIDCKTSMAVLQNF